jgi:hypothetical protein
MVSLPRETSFLPGFDPDSESEVYSKMLKAATMITRRNRTNLKNQQKEQQTNLFSWLLGRNPLALFYD